MAIGIEGKESMEMAFNKIRTDSEKLHASWLGWLRTLAALVVVLSCVQVHGPFMQCWRDETYSYAQGLALLQEASTALSMDIPLPAVVRVWRGGCIIRSSMLELFSGIYDAKPTLPNLLLDPAIAGSQLSITNLTGNPVLVMPDGFSKQNTPLSITLIGRLYDEASILLAGKAYQDATEWNKKHPEKFRH